MNRCLLNRKWCPRVISKNPMTAYLQRKLLVSSTKVDEGASEKGSINFYLKSLMLKDQLKPIRKVESFVKRSFFGELDKDCLIFPDLFYTEQERTLMTSQYDFIRQNFTRLCSDQNDLIECGLFNMDSLTLFEMSHIFEAIGASLNYQHSLNDDSQSLPSSNKLIPIGEKLMVTDSFITNYQETKTFVQSILPLLVHNLLTTGAINSSSNLEIKKKYLLEGTKPNIAFAFCELNDKFASLPYPYWDSLAVYNKDNDSWTLNGSKNRIIKNDYDYYVIFCKAHKKPNGDNSVNDFDVVPFLVDQKSLLIENDGSDNYGNQYIRISFKDLVLSREQNELFNSDKNSSPNEPLFALNIKARGQIAISAIILGIMKESMANIIKASSKHGSESIMKMETSQATEMIYSLESMLYLTASHFDSFDLNEVDLFLQALVVKTLATEFSNEMMNKIRFLFDAHQLSSLQSTQAINVFNVLDSFLDSANSNRMLLATNGLRYIGSWKFDHIAKMRLRRIYLNHFIKFNIFSKYKNQMLQRFSSSMDDFESLKTLHPSLKESSKLLKQVLNSEMKMGDHILTTYGKDCVYKQIDMNRFASIVMSAFQMISVISRTNQSLQKNSSQSQHELMLCRRICQQESKKVYLNTRLIYGVEEISEEKRSKAIHKRNIKFDGYFAKPTFDRII